MEVFVDYAPVIIDATAVEGIVYLIIGEVLSAIKRLDALVEVL